MRLNVGKFPYDAELKITLPGGDAGTFATLWAMKAFVDDAVERSPLLAELAGRIANACGRVKINRAKAVYNFLRDHVTFTFDPPALEHVQHPDQLIDQINRRGKARGDCDDVAVLGAALLKKMGLSPVFIVVGRDAAGRYEHVLYGVRNRAGRFFPIDSQHKFFGRLPNKVKRVQSFEV